MADTTARIRLALEGQGQVVRGMKEVEDSTTSLKQSMMALAGGLSVGAAVGKLVQVQREFDVLNASMITMTGSSAAAQREMAWIKDFAATTPYALKDVTGAFVKMKSLGLDPSQKALNSYGNTASAMGKDLNQMIEAVADAATGEFERLKEFGIKASKQGDQVSLTFQGVTTTIGNSADEITGYLKKIGDVNFAGAMEQRAKTLDGAISNLGDSWDELFRTISEAGVGNLMAESVRTASDALSGLSGVIRENRDELAMLTGALAGGALLATLPKLVAGLGATAAGVKAVTLAMAANPFGLLAIGVGAASGALIAYNRAQAETEPGIRKAIMDLESANNSLLNLKGQAGMSASERAGYDARIAKINELKDALDGVAKAEADKRAPTGSVGSGDTALLRAERAAYDAQVKAAADFWAKNQTGAQKMAAELKAARESMGSLFSPEIEAAIRKKYATATAGAKALTEAQRERAEHEKWLLSMEAAADDYRQEVFARRMDEHDKLLKAAQDAYTADLARYTAAAASAEQRLTDLQHEAEAMAYAERHQISMARAVEITTIARLKEKQVAMMGNEAAVIELQREIDARQKIVDMMAGNELRDAGRKLREDEAAEWARTWDQVAQSFTDALMQGGRSVKEYLKSLFRTLVLRPIIEPIGRGFANMLGGGGSAGSAGGGGGSLGNMGNMLSGANSTFAVGSQFFGGTMSSANAAGTLAANATGAGIDGLLASNGAYGTAGSTATTLGTAATAMGSALVGFMAGKMISGGYSAIGKSGNTAVVAGTAIGMAVAGPIGAIVGGMIGGAVNRVFGRKLKDSGIMGEFGGAQGFAGQQFEFYKGGLLRSDKTKTSALDDELRTALATQYELLANNTSGMAGQLKLSASALETYTRKIKFSTRGLTQDQITQRITEEFEAMGEEMAALVLGTKEYTRTGETASATLARLSSSITAANDMLDVLGGALFSVGLKGADMASHLVDQFGGIDAMAQAGAAYYQAYYSEAERADIATRLLTERMGDLGFGLPATTSEFRALVDGLDLTTESGRKTYAELLKLSPEFAALQAELQRLAEQTAAKLIATFTAKGALVPALDANALILGTVTKGTKDLNSQLGNHLLRADALTTGSKSLAEQINATRLTTASLATGMSTLSVQELLAQASAGTLGGSLTDTQVKALALATGLTEAQVRAGALSSGVHGLSGRLIAAATEALGFSGEVNTIHKQLGDASKGTLTFGDRLTSASSALTVSQAATSGLRLEILALRTAASGTVVDMTGLAAALANMDTRVFVATVVGVFELIGARIKETLSSITDERVALREAAITILGPGVMTPKQISARITESMVGMPSSKGVEKAQKALAKADALVLTREKALALARSLSDTKGASALTQAAALEAMRGKEARDLVATYLRYGNVQSGVVGESVPKSLSGLAVWEDTQASMLSKIASVPTKDIQAFADQLSKLGANNLRAGLSSTTNYLRELEQYNQAVASEAARLKEAEGLRQTAAELATKVTEAEKALASAKTAQTTATDAAEKAQLDYIDALQKYSLDASKAVTQLGRLREETVKYYESQKALFTLMTNSAQSLRDTVAAFRFDQLDPAAQLASLQERYNVAYSMAMSTSGEVLAGYADEMNGLLRPMLDKAQEAGVTGSQYSNLVKTALARAEATAGRLEKLAPTNYAAESLGLLGQIDSTLAALEAGAMTADQLIVSAINAGRDTTRDGLRAVVAALTGKPVPAFATGGAFTNGIVRRPTTFNMGLMGEAGDEAIMPLTNINGQLGVRAVGQDSAALVQEMRALRAEVSALRADNKVLQTQIMTNTGKIARQLDRWDVDGLQVKNLDGETLAVESA